MNPIKSQVTARDGVVLSYIIIEPPKIIAQETTQNVEQPPLILLHGLFSNAEVNWIKYGHAAQIAASGRRVILPDLRAHGASAAPQEAHYYPRDILLHDLEDLLTHLQRTPAQRTPAQRTPAQRTPAPAPVSPSPSSRVLATPTVPLMSADFDLGGFSLGARLAVQAVVSKISPQISPRRLIVAGMGLGGLCGWSQRRDFFTRAIASYDSAKRGDDVWMAIQFMKTMHIDPIAAQHVLASLSDIIEGDLPALTMATLLVCGAQDTDNGSAHDLAARLPRATQVTIPGSHMSSVTQPDLGAAIAVFLAKEN